MQTPKKNKEAATDLPTTPTRTQQDPPTTPQSQYVWRCRCCNSTHLHTPSPSRKHSTPKTPRHKDYVAGSPSIKRVKSTPGKSSLATGPARTSPSKKREVDKQQIQELLRQASPPRDLQASEGDHEPPQSRVALEPIMEVDSEPQAGPSQAHAEREEGNGMDLDSAPSYTPRGPFDPSADPGHNLSPEFLASLEEEDPSDSIAYTLPIYLSAQLAPSLQLFQYPLHHRPITVSPYAQSKGHTITARMKEAVERFELEVPVDMREDVWDEEKAEEMGFGGRDGMTAKEEKRKGKAEKEGWGSKMRLKSEEVPHVTGYWSGIVHDNALHVHPINKLVQLRPDLGYLDDLDKKKRNEESRRKRRGGDDYSGSEDDDEDEGAGKKGKAGGDELKSVTMQLASMPNISHESETRRTTKMGTGGTIGLTSQIRARIVKALKNEMEDTWRTWNWVEGEQMDEVADALGSLILPDENRTVLKCGTKNLDLISQQNIGDGAKLPN